jgi:hypothetical protein
MRRVGKAGVGLREAAAAEALVIGNVVMRCETRRRFDKVWPNSW